MTWRNSKSQEIRKGPYLRRDRAIERGVVDGCHEVKGRRRGAAFLISALHILVCNSIVITQLLINASTQPEINVLFTFAHRILNMTPATSSQALLQLILRKQRQNKLPIVLAPWHLPFGVNIYHMFVLSCSVAFSFNKVVGHIPIARGIFLDPSQEKLNVFT